MVKDQHADDADFARLWWIFFCVVKVNAKMDFSLRSE
jgi:hypothetical protein